MSAEVGANGTQRGPSLVHTSIIGTASLRAAARARDTVGANAPSSIAARASQTAGRQVRS